MDKFIEVHVQQFVLAVAENVCKFLVHKYNFFTSVHIDPGQQGLDNFIIPDP